jgi:hypothetical protein
VPPFSETALPPRVAAERVTAYALTQLPSVNTSAITTVEDRDATALQNRSIFFFMMSKLKIFMMNCTRIRNV